MVVQGESNPHWTNRSCLECIGFRRKLPCRPLRDWCRKHGIAFQGRHLATRQCPNLLALAQAMPPLAAKKQMSMQATGPWMKLGQRYMIVDCDRKVPMRKIHAWILQEDVVKAASGAESSHEAPQISGSLRWLSAMRCPPLRCHARQLHVAAYHNGAAVAFAYSIGPWNPAQVKSRPRNAPPHFGAPILGLLDCSLVLHLR